jgi:hypothetical protein
MLILLLVLTSAADQIAKGAEVRVSNSHLVTTCVAGKASDHRTWRLSEKTTFVFTMKNEPRPGVANQDPGAAEITFTPEAGHTYEIEVRGDATAYSRRVWSRGEWRPVVRDRTTDRIVSSDARWVESGCQP